MKMIVCSHAKLAEGMVSAVKLICGENLKIEFLNSYVDDCDIRKELQKILKDENESYCIMTDLFGGSVNQECMKYLNTRNIQLISGVNLAFVVEAAILNENKGLNEESIRELCDNSRNQLIYVNEFLKNNKFSNSDFD